MLLLKFSGVLTKHEGRARKHSNTSASLLSARTGLFLPAPRGQPCCKLQEPALLSHSASYQPQLIYTEGLKDSGHLNINKYCRQRDNIFKQGKLPK